MNNLIKINVYTKDKYGTQTYQDIVINTNFIARLSDIYENGLNHTEIILMDHSKFIYSDTPQSLMDYLKKVSTPLYQALNG